MSCKGIGEEFGKLADEIDKLSEEFDALIDKTTDKITGALGLPALEAKMLAEYASLKALLQGEFPSINTILDDLTKNGIPFAQELELVLNLANDGQNFVNEVERLKQKYGDEDDVINGILDDPAGFLRDLGGDLENLCESVPSIEKAKNGEKQLTVNAQSFDGLLDLEEIISEGLSPSIDRLKDVLSDPSNFIRIVPGEADSKITNEVDSVYST